MAGFVVSPASLPPPHFLFLLVVTRNVRHDAYARCIAVRIDLAQRCGGTART